MKTISIAALLLLAITPVRAEDAPPARKIDFSTLVLGLGGKPYQDCVELSEDGKRCAKSETLSLGKMAAAALSVQPQRGEPPVSLADQVQRGKLAQRLIDAKSEALESKDVTLIKDQIAKLGMPPVVVYHAIEMLDPASVK